MEYVITIEKREKNPKYEGDNPYSRGPVESQFIVQKEMYVSLTETEFQAVKKAVLGVM